MQRAVSSPSSNHWPWAAWWLVCLLGAGTWMSWASRHSTPAVERSDGPPTALPNYALSAGPAVLPRQLTRIAADPFAPESR